MGPYFKEQTKSVRKHEVKLLETVRNIISYSASFSKKENDEIYIDYFMVGSLVRFLFTSCEESQTHSLEDSLVRLRFFTTRE